MKKLILLFTILLILSSPAYSNEAAFSISYFFPIYTDVAEDLQINIQDRAVGADFYYGNEDVFFSSGCHYEYIANSNNLVKSFSFPLSVGFILPAFSKGKYQLIICPGIDFILSFTNYNIISAFGFCCGPIVFVKNRISTKHYYFELAASINNMAIYFYALRQNNPNVRMDENILLTIADLFSLDGSISFGIGFYL